MQEQYQPALLEQEAQYYWDTHQSFRATEDLAKEKFYCLAMFPYPSGKLHMGHARNYTLADVISRYQRMLGKNVLQPIGWDAFGLPAENAAMEKKVPPAEWTYANIEYMRERFKRLGFAYDWERELTTCKPEYYHWEQWLFLRLLQKGLVYRRNAVVNWDPVDQTVLANEQVIDGRGWRSGALVEQREIPQWFIKITAYAEELLNDLQKLSGWPHQVRVMQQNWIGRSEGAEVMFAVVNEQQPLEIFTTRPDTLLGATFMAVAPQHPLAKKAAQQNPQLQAFIEECQHGQVAEAAMATIEKKAMPTLFEAIHPISGDKLPIWVANYVLMEYGAGAVMAVPAHDERDFEVAQKYHLPIKPVIQSETDANWDFTKAPFVGEGILINSYQFNGLANGKAKKVIAEFLHEQDKGRARVHYRLRDWGVSRQRYWGTPIPIIYCDKCGAVGVPEEQLPVVLPENVKITGSGSPLKSSPEFYTTTCPQCSGPAKRETDTFDTFVESSWYYARFACANQNKAMLDNRVNYWTPVDHYVGGIEHAVLHLLYARFFHKVMRDEGLVNSDEPFTNLLTQGMVLKDGAKMSKSKGNVVEPEPLVAKYGADTVRLFVTFAAPPEQSLEWSDSGVEGSFRFLKRLWHYAYATHAAIKEINMAITAGFSDEQPKNSQISAEYSAMRRQIYLITEQACNDYARQQFNTVVSGCMKLLNLLVKMPEDNNQDTVSLIHEGMSILLRLLAPVAPHITHHLWRSLGYGDDILKASWPKVNLDALQADTIKWVIQINGKVRANLQLPTDTDQQGIEASVLADEQVQRHLKGMQPKKMIIVPGKVVNIVVADH